MNCKQTVEVTRHFEEQLEVEVTAKVMVSLIALTKPQTILFNWFALNTTPSVILPSKLQGCLNVFFFIALQNGKDQCPVYNDLNLDVTVVVRYVYVHVKLVIKSWRIDENENYVNSLE